MAIPAASPPPPTGIDDGAVLRQLLCGSSPSVPLAGDHARVVEGVDERRPRAVDVICGPTTASSNEPPASSTDSP